MARDLKLTKIPAFGFENEKWGAYDAYQEKAKFAAARSKKPRDVTTIEKDLRRNHNITKFLEYIPIFGNLLAIIGIRFKRGKQEYSVHFVERHVIAIVGLGFLLPIADIIATVVRNRKAAALNR